MGMHKRALVLIAVAIVVVIILTAISAPLTNGSKAASGSAFTMTMTGHNETSAEMMVTGTSGVPAAYGNATVHLRCYQDGKVTELGSWDLGSAKWVNGSAELSMNGYAITIDDTDKDGRFSTGDSLLVLLVGNETGIDRWSVGLTFPGIQGSSCDFSFVRSDTVPDLTVTFFDVGQGDAILIQTGDGKNILIDAGPSLASSVLVHDLVNRSVTVINAFILTHPDADHIGGAAEVLETFTVLSVYDSGYVKDTATYRSFVQAVKEEGCPVYSDDQIDPGDYLNLTADATFEVLSIDAHAATSNDASIVLEVRSSTLSFLFTGDISSDVEARLVANSSFDLHVDVLKVAHHGSKYSTSDAFLDAVTPRIAVISVGENDYGHPSPETLDRLYAHSVTVMRTDICGDITLTSG